MLLTLGEIFKWVVHNYSVKKLTTPGALLIVSQPVTSMQMESNGLKQLSTLRHLGGIQLSLEQQLIRGCLRAYNFDGACRSR